MAYRQQKGRVKTRYSCAENHRSSGFLSYSARVLLGHLFSGSGLKVAATLAALTLIAQPSIASAGPQKIWKARAAGHLRSARSVRSSSVAYFPRDSALRSNGRCLSKWCLVDYNGKRGWINTSSLMNAEIAHPPASALRPSQPVQPSPVTLGPSSPMPSFGGVTRAALQFSPPAQSAVPGEPFHQQNDAPRLGLAGLSATTSLSMREEPHDTSRVVGTISAGAHDIEDLKDCVRQWCLVAHNGVTGYIHRRFLANAASSLGQRFGIDGVSSGETVNVFDFPGADADRVGEIPFYASGIVPIGDCNADWCHIRYLGLVGWVRSALLVPEPQG